MLYLYKDDTGQLLTVPEKVRKIVSLCPSITESICVLGLEDLLVGRTRYCVLPETIQKSVPTVGGTKDPDVNAIRNLQADILIAVREENEKEHIDEIRKFCSVYVFDVRSFGDALMMMLKLGRLLDARQQAMELVNTIEHAYARLPGVYKPIPYLCLIWRKPWMAAGINTYIDSILSCTGLSNCLQNNGARYPILSEEDIRNSGAELLILPSEPYPFENKHIPELRELLPNAEIRTIDGQMISWFGARMLWAGDYLCEWLKGLDNNVGI